MSQSSSNTIEQFLQFVTETETSMKLAMVMMMNMDKCLLWLGAKGGSPLGLIWWFDRRITMAHYKNYKSMTLCRDAKMDSENVLFVEPWQNLPGTTGERIIPKYV
jgi:hypothetical protein